MPILPTAPWAMEEPPLPAPAEILVTGGDAPLPRAASAQDRADHATVPRAMDVALPSQDLPVDDAFPTLAALEAIRAAFAEEPPGPDEAARAELAALLGLDPALAAEEAAFMDALRDAPAPDGDALLAEWLSAARAAEPGVAPAPAADWPFP